MAAADRQTLAAIFHHPVTQNLSWMDALRLMTHLGSSAMPELIQPEDHLRRDVRFRRTRCAGRPYRTGRSPDWVEVGEEPKAPAMQRVMEAFG
jgi:hypothetical protein